MRPIPVEDEWIGPHGARHVIGPPAGMDPTGPIRSVEIVAYAADGMVHQSVPVLLEDEDLEALGLVKEGDGRPIFWITFLGAQIIPFDVSRFPPPEYQGAG